MVWLKFAACLAIILFAGTKLAHYGDVIAEKTGLGRIWVGLLLLAAITSMPELVTGLSAIGLVGLPDLAVGNLLGSCLFNLAILGLPLVALSILAVLFVGGVLGQGGVSELYLDNIEVVANSDDE